MDIVAHLHLSAYTLFGTDNLCLLFNFCEVAMNGGEHVEQLAESKQQVQYTSLLRNH